MNAGAGPRAARAAADRFAAGLRVLDACPVRLLAAAVACAAGLLSFGAWLALDRALDLGKGAVEYEAIARHLAAGHGFVLESGGRPVLWRPPLYPALLAAAFRLTAHGEAWVIGFQALCSALAAMLYALGAERILGRRAAVLGAVALSAHPLFAVQVGRLMPESVFSLVAAATFVLLVRYFHEGMGSARLWCAIGWAAGLGSLLRASCQFLVPFVVLWTAIGGRGRVPLRRLAAGAATMLAAFLATVAPWTWRNREVAGEWILVDTSGGYTFWVGNRLASRGMDDDPLPPTDRQALQRDLARVLGVPHDASFRVHVAAWGSAAASRRLYADALRRLAGHPLGTARLWLAKGFRFWFAHVGEQRGAETAVLWAQIFLLVPALAGLWLAWRDRRPLAPLLLLPVYLQAVHVASTAQVRYAVPILGHATLLAAYAVLRLAGLSGPGGGRR